MNPPISLTDLSPNANDHSCRSSEPSAPESRDSMTSPFTRTPAQRGPRLNILRAVRQMLVDLQALAALVLLLYWHSHTGVLGGERLMGAMRFSAIGSVVFFGIFLSLYLSIDRLESCRKNPYLFPFRSRRAIGGLAGSQLSPRPLTLRLGVFRLSCLSTR